MPTQQVLPESSFVLFSICMFSKIRDWSRETPLPRFPSFFQILAGEEGQRLLCPLLLHTHLLNNNNDILLFPDTCFLAWAVFQQHSHTLELSEFIGDSGSREVFHHITESPSPNDRDINFITKIITGGGEYSQLGYKVKDHLDVEKKYPRRGVMI